LTDKKTHPKTHIGKTASTSDMFYRFYCHAAFQPMRETITPDQTTTTNTMGNNEKFDAPPAAVKEARSKPSESEELPAEPHRKLNHYNSELVR
jgi:hypothetical protein